MKQGFIQFLQASESASGRSGHTFNGTPVNTWGQMVERGYAASTPVTQDAKYRANLREAQALYHRVMRGDKWAAFQFREAMTMSDFPTYFGDILDRSVLANYMETPYSWSAYAKRATIQDFREAHIFRFDRGSAVLDGPLIPNSYGATGTGEDGLTELSEYPMRKRVQSMYTDQLYKFGARMDLAWEVLVNDDLDALRDFPALLGRAARRTEEQRVTKLYTDATGPNATFFSAANKNIVNNSLGAGYAFITTNNPPLSITSLAWALQVMSMQRDLDGMPISIEGAVLVVPPALSITANNIVQATQVWMNDQGGTTDSSGNNAQRLITTNWANGRVTPVTNYFAPIVNTTSGSTAWYLFALPTGRPAMQLSFLRGHEAPELFMKSPNAIPIGEGRMGPGAGSMPGGAMSNPMDGDFEYDSVCYKERHILGGTLLDPLMGIASTGAGS